MNAHSECKWLPWLSLAWALFLVLLLPVTARFRSPGTVCSEWFLCAFAAFGLILLNVAGLTLGRNARLSHRIGLYLSSGIAIGVCFLLLYVWQEQAAFDHWAHLGLSYSDQP